MGRISNQEYQQITGTTKKTASRDLAGIVAKGIVQRVGTTGRGAFYVLARKGDIKGTKGTSRDTAESGRKRDKKRTTETGGSAKSGGKRNRKGVPPQRRKGSEGK